MTSAPGQRSPEGHSGPATAEDKRATLRLPVNLAARLTVLGAGAEVTCAADNLSEGGAHLRVPVACGLAVGQRLEVGFEPGPVGELGVSLAEDARYATVVRTEPRLYQPESQVGVGLRFDQPLFL